jgi:hypothetical protein
LYLGDNQKAVPHLIVDGIGLMLALTVILLPISMLAWAVTLAMTLPTVKRYRQSQRCRDHGVPAAVGPMSLSGQVFVEPGPGASA